MAAKYGHLTCLQVNIIQILSRLDCRGRLDASTLLDQHANSQAHMAAKYGHLTCLQVKKYAFYMVLMSVLFIIFNTKPYIQILKLWSETVKVVHTAMLTFPL